VGVSKQDVERGLASIMPPRGKPIRHHVPFSPGMKRSRELTMTESVRLGHNYVGTEHILLGLLCVPEEAGAQLLCGLGATHAGTEESIMNKLRELSQSQ
jgi:ATP-dependent Clp protease ATP-binding subunit ClpC